MDKLFLKSLIATLTIGLGQANPLEVNTCIVIHSGDKLCLQNELDGYLLKNEVKLLDGEGEDDKASVLVATRPVELASKLSLEGNAVATFENSLNISNGGFLDLKLDKNGVQVPLFSVHGKFGYSGNVNTRIPSLTSITNSAPNIVETLNKFEISIRKREGDNLALFDVSKQTGGTCTCPVNGNWETFLECYDQDTDLRNNPSHGLLPSLSSLKDVIVEPDILHQTKTSLANIVREKIKNYLGNDNYSPLRNMKIQDYFVEVGDSKITVFDTNKVKFVAGNVETIIYTDDDTRHVVEAKDGLSLMLPECDGVIDFYTMFNTKGENSSIPNSPGNQFVLWSGSVWLPLSNRTSNNTEFEFKTDLAPSEEDAKDLHLTGGEQNVTTVKFSGDNRAFKNKVVLHGSLNNIEFIVDNSKNGYVSIDATNVTSGDISLAIREKQNANSNISHVIDTPPVFRDNQKITFTVGQNTKIKFDAKNEKPVDFRFNKFITEQSAEVAVGKEQRKNVSLNI